MSLARIPFFCSAPLGVGSIPSPLVAFAVLVVLALVRFCSNLVSGPVPEEESRMDRMSPVGRTFISAALETLWTAAVSGLLGGLRRGLLMR
jgi:hypothetical protein